MCEKPMFQQSEEYHFEFQKGMYLSGRSDIRDATIVYSDIVEDFFWNYATQIRTKPDRVAALVGEVEVFLRKKSRVPCVYLTPWTRPTQELGAFLQEKGYSVQFQDAWMFLEQVENKRLARSIQEQLTIKAVETQQDMQAVLEVFAKAYGGEPTDDEPYGGLPACYLEALKQSTSSPRDVKTFHFVAYTRNEQPVAIATMVFRQGWGAIYNVGTLPESRGKGFGTAVSHACIDEWRKLGGRVLFLQTEAGSGVERWYRAMGFVTQFVGEGWVLSE